MYPLWTSVWSSPLPSPHFRPLWHICRDLQRTFCPFEPSSPPETHTHLDLMDMPEFSNKATQPTGTSLTRPQDAHAARLARSLQPAVGEASQEDRMPVLTLTTHQVSLEGTQAWGDPPHSTQLPCKRSIWSRWSLLLSKASSQSNLFPG